MKQMQSTAINLFATIASLATALVNGHTDSDGYETFTDSYGAVVNSFKLYPTLTSWMNASAICELEGAHLIVPNTLDEVKILEQLSKKMPVPNTKDQMHVGFTDSVAEGDWRSVMGGTFNASGFRSWENAWAYGEPNNVDNEDCAVLRMSTRKYNDVLCEKNLRAFVCEKEIVDDESPDVDERLRV